MFRGSSALGDFVAVWNESGPKLPPDARQRCFDICKEYTSYCRKLATKTLQIQKKNYKSTEDNHETNHINNKYNNTNMNTRKMHNT